MRVILEFYYYACDIKIYFYEYLVLTFLSNSTGYFLTVTQRHIFLFKFILNDNSSIFVTSPPTCNNLDFFFFNIIITIIFD